MCLWSVLIYFRISAFDRGYDELSATPRAIEYAQNQQISIDLTRDMRVAGEVESITFPNTRRVAEIAIPIGARGAELVYRMFRLLYDHPSAQAVRLDSFSNIERPWADHHRLDSRQTHAKPRLTVASISDLATVHAANRSPEHHWPIEGAPYPPRQYGILEQPTEIVRIGVGRNEIVMGRLATNSFANQLVPPDDYNPAASREHAKITWDHDAGVVVNVIGSNGLFVAAAGQKLLPPQENRR